MVHEITRVSISVPSNRSRSGMVHGPGIGTGGVVRPLEWVIFLRGCICIYILTTRLDLTPSTPAQTFTTAHLFTTASYRLRDTGCVIPVAGCVRY